MAKRGRVSIQLKNDPRYVLWLSKKNEYSSDKFQKVGTARVSINLNSKKIGLHKGSKIWMKKMFALVIPIFAHKHITNNRIESKTLR